MPKILVVDDEEDIRSLVNAILEGEDYDIETATSGDEALKLLKKTRFDLIILDVVMQNMDGLELCRRIRGTSRLRETPILMFSALGKGVQTMLGDGEKADEYLDKPFDKKDLLEKVGRLLGEKP